MIKEEIEIPRKVKLVSQSAWFGFLSRVESNYLFLENEC